MGNLFSVQHNVVESDQYKRLSTSAKALYLSLCQLSNRHGKKTEDNWFDRSIGQLRQDTSLSDKTITKARQELVSAHMIQVIIEPDYTAHIPIRFRIVQWERPMKKYVNNYRKISHSNYRKKYEGSNTKENPIELLISDRQYKQVK